MRVIFSKTDALGDQLFASGYVRHILSQIRPDALVWFVRKGYEGISALFEGSRVFLANTSAESHDEAKRLLTMAREVPPFPWGGVLFAPLPLDAYSAWPEERDLRQEISWWFDFVEALGADIAVAGTINLNWVDEALVLASRAGKRVGVRPHQLSQKLPEEVTRMLEARHITVCFTHSIEYDPRRHELDSFVELLRVIDEESQPLEVSLDPIEPPLESSRVDQDRPTLVVAPGAGDLERTYPLDKLAEAIRLMASMDRYNFLILSGPKDAEMAERLLITLQAKNISTRLLDLRGDEIPKLVGILREASLLICNETFVVHLASYLGTPTVALWGGGHWGRFLPRSGRVTILHIPMLCRPCNWVCCFSERHCLVDFSPIDIANAALRRLEVSRKSAPFVETIECASSFSDDQVLDALRARSEECLNLQTNVASLRRWLDLEIEAKNKEHHLAQEAQAMKGHWERLFREAEQQRDAERELRVQEAAAKQKALDWARDAEAMKTHWEGLFRTAEQQRDKERDLRVQEAAAKEAALKWAQAAESMKTHWETLFRAAESQRDHKLKRRQSQIKGETE